MLDRVLLARYLRQRAELGERELFLDGSTAGQLLAALTVSPRRGAGDSAGVRESRRVPTSASGAKAMIREILATSVTAAPGPADARGTAAAPRSSDPPVPPSRPLALPSSAPGGGSTALAPFAAEAAACTACRLSQGRRNVVFGEGSPSAQLVIVGEAPGQEEDRTGRPFVGPAGKLLDLLLMSAGFPRDAVYICNTLKCRPPQNRNPLPDELAACSRLLRGQLSAIGPKVLLAVGTFAARTLAGSEDNISRLRGRVFVYEGVPLVVTYHPAFLLRSPQWTLTAWEDFQLARKVLDEQA